MPAMNTLVVAILIVGAMSFAGMRREVFPEFELEIILVNVPYPGATPEEVEEGICQKVEEACRSVSGIKKLTSVAQEGVGFCIFELDSGTKIQKPTPSCATLVSFLIPETLRHASSTFWQIPSSTSSGVAPG
jgi:multidrug efflux pump subunit AcrB